MSLPAIIPPPAPLTPADCDLRSYPYMPLHVLRLRDAAISSAVPDAEARWTSLLLWAAAWHQVPCASLPDDDAELSRLAGFGRAVDQWRAVRAAGALYGFIRCNDERWYHPVVAEVALEAWATKLKYRARGQAGNAARWGDGIAEGSKTDPSRKPRRSLKDQKTSQGEEKKERRGEEQNLREGVLPPSESLDAPPPRPAAGRGTRIPVAFEPGEKGTAFALAKGFTPEQIDEIVEAFVDWWRAQPGTKGVKIDWPATWRTWIRNEANRRNGNGGRKGPGPTVGGWAQDRADSLGRMQQGALDAVDRHRRPK